jgi:hypothetical protein
MEKKSNKWFITTGVVLAVIVFLISSIFIRLTPFFYVIPFFLILFGIINYTHLKSKWAVIIAIIVIVVFISICLFFSWLRQLPPSSWWT